MNKAKPEKQAKVMRANSTPKVSLLPTMSEMIKQQAHNMKRAGRMKY